MIMKKAKIMYHEKTQIGDENDSNANFLAILAEYETF